MDTTETKAPKYCPTADQLVELKAKHGERLQLLTRADLEQAVVVKPVSRAAYKRFRQQSDDVSKRDAATENLVRDCGVWPDPGALSSQFDAFPAADVEKKAI